MVNQIQVKDICQSTTQEWLQNGALLVYVFEKEDVDTLLYDSPKIINISLSDFDNRFSEIPKDKEVVMVCKSGGRNLRTVGFLVNHRYTNEVNMKQGIARWAQKGFPTKGDSNILIGDGYYCSSSGCC